MGPLLEAREHVGAISGFEVRSHETCPRNARSSPLAWPNCPDGLSMPRIDATGRSPLLSATRGGCRR